MMMTFGFDGLTGRGGGSAARREASANARSGSENSAGRIMASRMVRSHERSIASIRGVVRILLGALSA